MVRDLRGCLSVYVIFHTALSGCQSLPYGNGGRYIDDIFSGERENIERVLSVRVYLKFTALNCPTFLSTAAILRKLHV